MFEKPLIDPLSREILYILRCEIAFNRIFERLKSKSHEISYADVVDEIFALRGLNNELLVRLLKFLDRSTDAHTLFYVVNSLNTENKDELKKEVSELRAQLKPFYEIRNKTLAHLERGYEDNWDSFYNIMPVLKRITILLDKLNGEKLEYHWKEDRGFEIDLRKELHIDE